MPFADINGCRTHYRFDGPEDAPLLMLSNSLGTTLAVWDGQIPAFTRHFRVLRYDTRGHGESAVTPGPYSMAQLAEDVAGLLDHLGSARVDFIGLSMGGMVGLWLAIHAPQRIGRLVLSNTGARIGTPEIWNPRIEAVTKGGMAAVSAGVIERWFTPDFQRDAPDQVAPIAAMVDACSPAGYTACCAAVRDMDERERVSRVTAPTLVITGTADQATPPEVARFLADNIAGARYAELPASHLAVIESAGAYRAAALAFLTGEGGRVDG